MINELPKDWKWVKLGEVCHTTSGGTPSRRETKYYNGNIPWVKSGELDKGIITDTEEKISEEAVKNSSAKIFPKGTLLIALYGATIGKLAFLGVDAATNQAICGIYKNEKIDSHFLYNYLFYKKQKLVNQGIGGAQPNISQTILKNLELPLPPLTTQQAIVTKIEELFSELDKGIEQLKTAQQQLKTYRQSVLKWAFEGKLTTNRIDNFSKVVNSNEQDLIKKEILQSSNSENSASDKCELPKGWKWVRLGDVCNRIQDGSHYSPQIQFDEPGENRYKYITAKNIRNDYMDFRKVTYVDKSFHESIYSRCKPEFGDVLLTKDGVNTGDVTLNTLQEEFSLLSSVCLFKTKAELLIPSFLKYYIQSPIGNKNIIGDMSGTAIKRIVLKKIKASVIVLPPYKEQHQIVQAIESRLSVADKMEESITQSLQQSEALRQSILKKAFEGRLV